MQLEKEQLTHLYRTMLLARRVDETIVKGLLEGKVVSFFHSGQGEEAVGVGGCSFLNEDDYVWGQHRGHGIAHVLAKGGSATQFIAEHYGKIAGSCRGISANHFCQPEIGMLGAAGTIGSAFPLSLGWAVAAKKRARGQVVLCFFGDGASNRGTLHEAMNLATLWKLPLVYVCHNNLYAQYTPIKDAYPREDIADLAGGFGIPGVIVDGQDVIAVHEAVQAAVARARSGGGPSLTECKTYRYRAHSEGVPDVSHADPRPPEELEAWKKRDPIKLFGEALLAQGVLSQGDLDRIDKEATDEVEAAEKAAMESPVLDPATLETLVYAS
ncbi:MAG TPA: thiamine pyrophosphate-dependent dehydrogenase E1 component subunit alpha [Dehalococcoidia bacterium]|nr:thiamine pyrophosphate-dependent dehydrogenase E1 component subunit alpha [Dehalococcoidia bacterium]